MTKSINKYGNEQKSARKREKAQQGTHVSALHDWCLCHFFAARFQSAYKKRSILLENKGGEQKLGGSGLMRMRMLMLMMMLMIMKIMKMMRRMMMMMMMVTMMVMMIIIL